MDKYQVGSRLNGTITKIVDYGFFVKFSQRRSGLLHQSDFRDFESAKEKFAVGQQLRVVITKIKDGRLELSLNRVNDQELVDPNNQFVGTPADDFYQTLTQTLDDATEKITELEKQRDDR